MQVILLKCVMPVERPIPYGIAAPRVLVAEFTQKVDSLRDSCAARTALHNASRKIAPLARPKPASVSDHKIGRSHSLPKNLKICQIK
jgi:hypothetical protein